MPFGFFFVVVVFSCCGSYILVKSCYCISRYFMVLVLDEVQSKRFTMHQLFVRPIPMRPETAELWPISSAFLAFVFAFFYLII